MPDIVIVTPEDGLSQKRQLVYASLLRYAPETAPLRERIFDRLVIAALLGSDGKNAYRIGAVQSNLVFGANVPGNLRVERIQESLKRLQDRGKVEVTQVRQRHAYYLSAKGQDELKSVIGTAGDVLQPVLRKLLANTDHSLSYEAGSKIVQGFIFECFARFGAQMAKTVTGQLESSDLLRNADAAAAFDAAVAGADLSPEVRESLQSRCIQFLKSEDSDDLNLKFCLAQGYYFAQLVGLQDGGFSPLAEQAFNGSSFYLDTNVLLYGLLPDKEDRAVFTELLVLAERLNIKLVVTRATIKETLSLPDNFSKELSRVLKVLPGELIDRVKDQLTESFLRARDENPGMTLDVFLEDIRGVQEVVKARWGISILEEGEDQIGEVPAGIAIVIQEEAVKSRGWEKPEAALRHDVAHFFLIQRERAGNPKSWFLTRDRGLAVAATLLAAQGEQPFTFDFHGFLQTVSPFLVSTGEQLGVASIISAMLVDQLFPRDRVFNLKELFLLAEMHQDVLSTPKEQLIQAVDYVKSTVLAGKTYKPADFNHVSLGLKSFLACSSEQQRQELERQKEVREREAEEQKQLAAEERRLRQESQRKIQEQLLEIADLRETGAERDQELASLKAESDQKLYRLSRRAAKAELRMRFFWMLVGYAAGIGVWSFEGRIAGYAAWKWNPPLSWTPVVLVVRLVGLMAFMLPSTGWLRRVGWKENRKIAFLALSLLIGLRWAKLAEASVSIYSMSALATSVGTLLLLIVDRTWLLGGRGTTANGSDSHGSE
jgi:hypothetical protein